MTRLPVTALEGVIPPPDGMDQGRWYTLAYAEALLTFGLKASLSRETPPVRGLTQGYLKVAGSTVRVELDPEAGCLRGIWGHCNVELDSSQLVALISLVQRKLARLHAKPPKDQEAYQRQADFLAKLLSSLREGGAAGKLTH